MNVNGIGNQNFYEKTKGAKTNRAGGSKEFYERLSENINDKSEAAQKKENTAVSSNAVTGAGYQYCNVSSTVGVYESSNISAVTECDVKNITYQESDYVKAYALQGYTLMAQVSENRHSVYIEQKMEDGIIKGYEVNLDELDKNTKNPIEQAALEAWEKKTAEDNGETELTDEEALLAFYEFVEDRIKNGPPKYQIGNAEYSIADWNKLLESIDDQIDAIKEELREWIEKMKEQQMKAELSQEQAQENTSEEDAEKIEEELLMSLFQDKGVKA